MEAFTNLHNDSEIQTTATPGGVATAAIRKCLHPPSSVPNYTGLPTNDARSQVCIEWRDMEIMQTPRIYDSTIGVLRDVKPDDLDTFDYAFLIPNGANIKSIGFIYNKVSGKMEQDYNGLMLEQLYDFDNWYTDATVYRTAYKSSTFKGFKMALFKGDDSAIMCESAKFIPNRNIIDATGHKLKLHTFKTGEFAGWFLTPYGMFPDVIRYAAKFLGKNYIDKEHFEEAKMSVQERVAAVKNQMQKNYGCAAVEYHYKRINCEQASMVFDFLKNSRNMKFNELSEVTLNDNPL